MLVIVRLGHCSMFNNRFVVCLFYLKILKFYHPPREGFKGDKLYMLVAEFFLNVNSVSSCSCHAFYWPKISPGRVCDTSF